MPPKPAPKLTKKQIEQQKKQQLRLQKQKQQQEAAAEKARLEEEQKLRQIQRKKKSQQQRLRIVQEKQRYHPILQERIKYQNEAYEKLMKEEKWKRFTTSYLKDYSVQGTSLSTFKNLFTNFKHKNPKLTLQECEQCQKYITKLQQKSLEYRANYNEAAEMQCLKSIQSLQKQQLSKLEQIMIEFANSAQEMQQKNVEQAKKKNQQNAAQKATKPIDSVYEMSENFKIGMYINTISTKNYNKFNPVAIKQFGFNSEVPPKWTNNTSIVKFQWVNFNHFSPQNNEEFRIVGGVFNLQFYDMFVGTKKTNNICIKRFYKDREILQKFKLPPSAIKEPFKIMYQIPKYIFMAPYTKSTLKIAQYEVGSGRWAILPNESITDYLEQEKRVICKVSRPEPVAFVENKCADYPYIAWQLRTVQAGKILLDFQLGRTLPSKNGQYEQFMIQFEIGPNVLKLNLDTVYPEFKDLTESYFTPEQMLWQLSKRGVHLLPAEDEYEYAGVKKKDREAEKNAIRDIAYAVEAFTIRSEPNDSSDIKIKMRENLDYEYVFLEDQQKDWKRIRWGDKDKCWVDGRNVMQRHCNLQILLQQHDICFKQCAERVKFNKQFLLRKTVMKVLQLTRVLAFTTAKPNLKSRLVDVLKQKIIVA